MSRIAFNGNPLGTGTVTITSPNTNTDQTVTLPDQTGTLVLSGNAASFSSVVVSAGSAAAPSISPTGDSNTGVFFPAADTIAFSEGGTESMRITSAGDVGIGTTSPAGKLHVAGSFRQTGATAPFEWTVNPGATDFYKLNAVGFADNLIVATAAGNVGIGTNSPGAKLDVNGPASVTNFTGTTRLGATVRGSSGATDYSGIDFIGGNQVNPLARIAVLSTGGGSFLSFGTSNNYASGITNTAMSIDSSGNLLVGTTTNSPSARIFANVTSAQNAIAAYGTTSSMTHFLASTTLSTAGGSDAFGAYDAGGKAAGISTNGFYQSRPNSYGGTSDLKLKENVIDATPKLDALMQVKVRNYNYKGEPDVKQIGVIAQELEQVFPGLVYETADRSPEGKDLGTTTKNVKYSVFVPMLIKAIQEQQAMITAQASAITALTARIAALEGTQP
jgi:hypothetical protein